MKTTLENVIKRLTAFYGEALTQERIRKPLSWALYQTWKWCDELEQHNIRKGENNDKQKPWRPSGRRQFRRTVFVTTSQLRAMNTVGLPDKPSRAELE